jgi:hypothetical protein
MDFINEFNGSGTNFGNRFLFLGGIVYNYIASVFEVKVLLVLRLF